MKSRTFKINIVCGNVKIITGKQCTYCGTSQKGHRCRDNEDFFVGIGLYNCGIVNHLRRLTDKQALQKLRKLRDFFGKAIDFIEAEMH